MNFLKLVILSGLVFYVSCGNDDGTQDPSLNPTTSISTIGAGEFSAPFSSLLSIPAAVGPVLAQTSLRITTTASTGLPMAPSPVGEFGHSYTNYIGSDNLADFFPPNTGSYSACEALNYARGAYGTVGNGDMMSCFIGRIADEKLTSDTYAYYSLNMTDESIKFKVRRVNADDGKLKAMEVFSCFAGKQEEYFTLDFSAGDVQMYFKGQSEPENPQVDLVTYEATVTADGVSSEGILTGSKNMQFRYRNLFSDSHNNQVVTSITQTPDRFTYNGFSCERASLTTDCDDRSQAIFAYAEILDFNEAGGKNPNLFALGDGAAHVAGSNQNGLQQWNGDTGEVANDPLSAFGEYVQQNINSKAAIAAEFADITFTAEESWDCADEGEEISQAAAESAMLACGIFSIDQNVHLECGGGGNANLSSDVIN